MSDNSFKGKARRQQKATGSSYMRARREVDNHSKTAPAGGMKPTADAAMMLSLMGLDHAGPSAVSALWADRALPVGTDEPVDDGPLLRLPLGLQAGGAPVWLDLKTGRPALDAQPGGDGPHGMLGGNDPHGMLVGHGPHGIVVGCPGSGKSTALRTLLFGLCVQHSPEQVKVTLVSSRIDQAGADGLVFSDDYSAFDGYPHIETVVGVNDYKETLTKLMADRARALRAADAIALAYGEEWNFVDDGAVAWANSGATWPHVEAGLAQLREGLADVVEEMAQERIELAQELDGVGLGHGKAYFEPAGSIGRYNQVRSTPAGAHLPPVPYMVVVVDTWERLASKDPVVSYRLFEDLMRKGPDLGIHVVIASEVIQDNGTSNLAKLAAYRIVLRASSIAKSQAAIGSDAAHNLPRVRGVGLFRPSRAGVPGSAKGVDPVTYRGFLLREEWIHEVGRQMSAASTSA